VLPRFFEEGDNLLALYAREAFKELLDRIARCQMIKKTLHRNASPSENWLTAENFGSGIPQYSYRPEYCTTSSPQNDLLGAFLSLSTIRYQPPS
jgi:hypothetical protein